MASEAATRRAVRSWLARGGPLKPDEILSLGLPLPSYALLHPELTRIVLQDVLRLLDSRGRAAIERRRALTPGILKALPLPMRFEYVFIHHVADGAATTTQLVNEVGQRVAGIGLAGNAPPRSLLLVWNGHEAVIDLARDLHAVLRDVERVVRRFVDKIRNFRREQRRHRYLTDLITAPDVKPQGRPKGRRAPRVESLLTPKTAEVFCGAVKQLRRRYSEDLERGLLQDSKIRRELESEAPVARPILTYVMEPTKPSERRRRLLRALKAASRISR